MRPQASPHAKMHYSLSAPDAFQLQIMGQIRIVGAINVMRFRIPWFNNPASSTVSGYKVSKRAKELN